MWNLNPQGLAKNLVFYIINLMLSNISRSAKLKYLCFMVALVLVLSFGFHTVGFDHHHPLHIFGEDVEAVMHGGDKKLWLLLLLTFIAIVGAIFWKRNEISNHQHMRLLPYSTPSNNFLFDVVLSLDPIRQAIRCGIIHPKICE